MELVKFHENDFMKTDIEVIGKAEIVILNVKNRNQVMKNGDSLED